MAINQVYVQKNSYHNATHGADVANSVLFMASQAPEPLNIFTALEVFGLLFAAVVHDIGHKGVNNSFLVQTQDPLALIYNDISVLEQMHVCLAFQLIEKFNLLSNMSECDYLIFRKIVTRLVLDTDLQRHFQIIEDFKNDLNKTIE